MKNQLLDNKIESLIVTIRNQKVILVADLAQLYGVSTKQFNQAVKRNIDRFPVDFMFQLTEQEIKSLRSQILNSNTDSNLKSQFVTSSLIFQIGISSWGGRRKLPYAFTEYGVAMLSSVLNSERAIKVNIEIMRTFGKLRRLIAAHADLTDRLDAVEKKYDEYFRFVFEAIHILGTNSPEDEKKGKMGFG
jgi:hypothetical protein